jgi:hypothetical protein
MWDKVKILKPQANTVQLLQQPSYALNKNHIQGQAYNINHFVQYINIFPKCHGTALGF